MTDEETKTNEIIKEVNLVLPNVINCNKMFKGCTELTDIDLTIPNATFCYNMFEGCSNLTDAKVVLYNAIECESMFYGCSSLINVDLSLPRAKYVGIMFYDCTSLTDVDLKLPNVEDCGMMFYTCAVENVKLNMPKLSSYSGMFGRTPYVKTIDVIIPSSIASDFKSDVLDMLINPSLLTSFKINGVEQID